MRAVTLEEQFTVRVLAARIGRDAIPICGLTPGGHLVAAVARGEQIQNLGPARQSPSPSARAGPRAGWVANA